MLLKTGLNTSIFKLQANPKLIVDFGYLFSDLVFVGFVQDRLFVKLELKFTLHFPLKLFDIEAGVLFRKSGYLDQSFLDILVDFEVLGH